MVAKFFLGIRLPQELEKECEAWRRKFRPRGSPYYSDSTLWVGIGGDRSAQAT